MKYLIGLLLVFTMGCSQDDLRGEHVENIYAGTVADVQYDNKMTSRWQSDPYMIIKSSRGMFYALNTVAPIAIGDGIVEVHYSKGYIALYWGIDVVKDEKIVYKNIRNRSSDGKDHAAGYWVRN